MPFAFRLRDCGYEPGTEQFDCFRTDFEQTRVSYRTFFAERSRRLAEEETFLGQILPVGAISDIPALAIRAAANLEIPSVGVFNFSWDWLQEPILEAAADRETLDTLRVEALDVVGHRGSGWAVRLQRELVVQLLL